MRGLVCTKTKPTSPPAAPRHSIPVSSPAGRRTPVSNSCVGPGAAALVMAVRLRAPLAEFRAAMPWVAAGAAVAFGLWFVGFMVVGGEWFLMWQSSTWNGQEAAFRFYLTVLAVSAYVLLDTDEG
jgi:predicted small integral membrane protein